MKLKKLKSTKILLLKLFVLQQKNKLNFNIALKQGELLLLIFLWKSGYILGFSCWYQNVYTIFLKKQFKQFSANFFECNLNSQTLYSHYGNHLVSTPVILSPNGLQFNKLFNKNIGGFLLCNLF